MLKKKIEDKNSGILLYGMVPPKATHEREKLEEIAKKQIDRISKLKVDGIILYDIQDESDRTNIKRPFPFLETISPTFYVKEFLHVTKLPIIIYRSIGKYTKEQTTKWLQDEDIEYSVFVGAASASQTMSLSMNEAYALKQKLSLNMKLGGIAIPERHSIKNDEHERVLAKINSGCEFFVTQAVYNLEVAKKFLDDYEVHIKKNNKELVPIIFTLTPCGSTKTLEFMKWLGIQVPQHLEDELKASHDILSHSVKLSQDIFHKLYHYGISKGIPIGCNVESVAVRKAEIEASVELLKSVAKIMKRE